LVGYNNISTFIYEAIQSQSFCLRAEPKYSAVYIKDALKGPCYVIKFWCWDILSYLHVICTRHEGVVVKRAKKYSTNLSHKSDPVDRWYMREYCSLFNGFSTDGLRAYRCRFSGNKASIYTKNYLFHCRISTLL